MQTFFLDKIEKTMSPSVATIGFFDGVHCGHRFLINHLKKDAEASGMSSMVITFDRHPRQVLQADYQPQLLTTFDEKQLLLSKTGIDQCVVLPFDRQMAQLSARDFMEKVLAEKLNVKKLYIGYDHHFGHNREEGFEDYVHYGRQLGIDVIQAPAFELEGISVSSSVIRSLLHEGEVSLASRCLGYPYFMWGRVTTGMQEGRKLGYPTANLVVDRDKLIPASGVYAVNARLEGTVSLKPAMMNIGHRPTFDGQEQTLEVHILNFSDNLYDKELAVGFLKRLREERRFSSKKELQEQLAKDAEQATLNLKENENENEKKI